VGLLFEPRFDTKEAREPQIGARALRGSWWGYRNIFIVLFLLLEMAIGISILVIAILIIAVWVIVETKRMKHKVFAIFLIGLILFSYLSINFVMKGEEIDLTSIDGVKNVATLYMSWMGTIFINFKTLTTRAIKMDWKGNETG
jgi:hypothetical protein